MYACSCALDVLYTICCYAILHQISYFLMLSNVRPSWSNLMSLQSGSIGLGLTFSHSGLNDDSNTQGSLRAMYYPTFWDTNA